MLALRHIGGPVWARVSPLLRDQLTDPPAPKRRRAAWSFRELEGYRRTVHADDLEWMVLGPH